MATTVNKVRKARLVNKAELDRMAPMAQDGASGEDGANAQASGKLTRLAAVPAGAEVTGAFLTRQGDLFSMFST